MTNPDTCLHRVLYFALTNGKIRCASCNKMISMTRETLAIEYNYDEKYKFWVKLTQKEIKAKKKFVQS